MTRTLLVTETESLRVRPGGPATANIWLDINGCQFPMHRWNDFAVVVMGWWAVALLRLFRGVSSVERVDFMDGPYTVEVSKTSSGTLHFRALKGSDRTDEVAIAEGPAMPFVLGLISQSREILDACKRHAWWSKDADVLESSVEVLNQESTRLQG